MSNYTRELQKRWGIDRALIEELLEAQEEARLYFPFLEEVSSRNHLKVLHAFQKLEVTEYHFSDSTGYGYGDLGREVLDKLFALVFGAEAGLVRPQIVSGTHALFLCLHGVLRPGDTFLSVTGRPYDTLASAIGQESLFPGRLTEWGINYLETEGYSQGIIDVERVKSLVAATRPRLCLLQRSRGYSERPSLSVEDLGRLIKGIKEVYPEAVCLVDNCYGEFVETLEPAEVGADLVAGSLIKNPGGGLAPGGGYIVGRNEFIERIAHRLTSPGLGGTIGAFSGKRAYFQGLFLAPLVVSEALKGAVLGAAFFKRLGFRVAPDVGERRSDIVQAIYLGTPKALEAFCVGIQKSGPVDSQVIPEAAPLPGYDKKIIMAGGTFIQGSSIELSADAPVKEPYIVYLQGGLSYEYTKIAMLMAAQELVRLRNVQI